MFQDKGPQGAKLFDPKRSEEYQGGGEVTGLDDKFTNAAYREGEEAREAKIAEVKRRLTAGEITAEEANKLLEELKHPVDKYLDRLRERRDELGGVKKQDEQKAA